MDDWHRLARRTFAKSKRKVYTALVANKTDLLHQREVSPTAHDCFAEENDMYSYFMSAKSGDRCAQVFYRIAADLAGCLLTKSEVDIEAKCVKAEIIEYERNDPKGGETKLERALPPGVRRKRKTCIIS